MLCLRPLLGGLALAFCLTTSQAAPVSTTEMTWHQLYEYAVGRSSVNDTLALGIHRYVLSPDTAADWDSQYNGEIVSDDGTARLVVNGAAHDALDKRTYDVTAYPYVDNCDSSALSYRWDNMGLNGCYTFWWNGQQLRIYSTYIENSDPSWFFVAWSSQASCQGQVDRVNGYATGCLGTYQGQGFLSFMWLQY